MKVILMADVRRLGKAGEVVSVKDGFGRNFLIPQGLAMEADAKQVKALEHMKKVATKKAEREERELTRLEETLNALELRFSRQAGEGGKLFGSVTNLDVEAELEKAGLKVERKKIILPEPIKSLGDHLVTVKVGPERTASLKVVVARLEQEEE